MDVKEKILDAIQLLASNSVKKAGYDKTIQAQVVSCEDATIGKYRCRYQDSTFYAYASTSDTSFSNGSYVYILVPENDFKKEKTILGTTAKLGINYISQAEGDEAYEVTGTNCITFTGAYYLNTNNKNYKYVLYDHSTGFVANGLNLDETALNQYIKESSSLIVGATFKTSIPSERQARGHYGIIYDLVFLDNATNQQTHRSYIVDEDNMTDNPYRLLYPTRQYEIFDIDGTNFVRVDSIAIFNADFPNADGNVTDGLLTSGDIEITNLEISGAVRMSDEEINGIGISFFTPQGTFFTKDSPPTAQKQIVAQVKIRGKIASSAQRIPFYWGKENVGITPSHEKYNKQLGRGWECLNDCNSITKDANDSFVVEWVPHSDNIIINFTDATARENKYKVAIVYENTIIAKQITIKNLAATAAEITIESDKGNQFYYDIGHPTLTCVVKIDDDIQTASNYTYKWAYESDKGVITDLPETTTENANYDAAVATKTSLENEITAGKKFANKEATNLTNARNAVQAFDFIQRVKDNKVYDVQIRNITNRGIFKCSVFNGTTHLGTAAIILTNTLEGQKLYSLVINNGSETFQYDEGGIAPNNKSLNEPQELKELTFTVYDNLGEAIDSNLILNSPKCDVIWYFPIKDTLLEYTRINEDGTKSELNENHDSTSSEDETTDAELAYKIYKKNERIVYGIAQKYDVKKKFNQIKLNVNYKGMNLTAETNFTFVKQGEPGTNGTEFIVKLIPNTKMDNPPNYPIITTIGTLNKTYELNYYLGGQSDINGSKNINVNTGYQFLKAQLYRGGQLIWEGFKQQDYALDNISRPTAVHWDIVKNKYNSNWSDASAFVVSTATSGHFSYTGDHLQNDLITPLANIIKCEITWEDKTYYGTIPIFTAWAVNDNYRFSLRDYTGFKYVMYTSDGVKPQYDNSHPFEFVCQEKIDNIWEDVSQVVGDHKISYFPSANGNIIDLITGNTSNYRDENLLQLLNQSYYRKGKKDNQWEYRPASRYDGQCVNVAVLCQYKQNGNTIGKIHIPIHFLLNRYGLAHINAWDGNSVQINEEGGYILSPQMGAGTKDNYNNFTGVLMGQVKVAGKRDPDIGLLGYLNGERSFFINSRNGSALFGKSGANNGQIIIDPTNNQAMLYSNNFWKDYDNETGLPKNYSSENEWKDDQTKKGRGLLINLTKPEIRYGSGDFSVDQNGHLIAKGGGNIAGWQIKDKYLQSENNSLTLRSTTETVTVDGQNVSIPPAIYSENHKTLRNTGAGFFLSDTGLSIGSKFYADNTGIVKIGLGAVSNDPNASKKHWTIDANDQGQSYIAYKTNTFANNVVNPTNSNEYGQAFANNSSVYLGTNGLSLGRHFSVDNYGKVSIIYGSIDMRTHANTTRIKTDANGNWMQDSNGNLITETVSAGKQLFYVDTTTSSLVIHVNNGTINLGNKFTVDNQGNMRATSGKIGGFFIGNKYLTNPSTLDEFIEVDTTDAAQKNKQKVYSVYLGTDGISLGKNFSVNNQGIMKIRRGSIQLGYRASDGSWNFSVDDNGNMNAKSGYIGGITIQNGGLLAGTLINDTNYFYNGFRLLKSGHILFGPPLNRTMIIGEGNVSNVGNIVGGWVDNGGEGALHINCQIQPWNGFGKFGSIDIVKNSWTNSYYNTSGNLSLAGKIQGFTFLDGSGNAGSSTFKIESSDGMIYTAGGIKGYSATGHLGQASYQTFWISSLNGKSKFTEVNTASLTGVTDLTATSATITTLTSTNITANTKLEAGRVEAGTVDATNVYQNGSPIVARFG